MAKTKTERIVSIEEQIAKLEAQKKLLIQKQNAEERKARTKRLIERGAILESLIDGAESLTNEQVKALLEKTVATDYGKRILASIAPQDSEAHAEELTPEGQTQAPADTNGEGNSTREAG